LALVNEVRACVDAVHTGDYGSFLNAFLPAFDAVLETTPPQLEDNNMHKTRKCVLEMLNKLPHNEHLRPHDKTVLRLATSSLRVENEENALICLRVIFDLHRNFRPSLEFEVEPFLEFFRDVYEQVEGTVAETFGDGGGKKASDKRKEPPPAPVSIKSTRSFKVQTECPLIVMLLFQLYARLIPSNVTTLLPLMVKTIGLKVRISQTPRSASAIAHTRR
jgi:transformation/transcription domain-associated protein